MSLTRILLAGAAAVALSTAASANDTYRCNDRLCYDDQADETRELNRQQLENPGAGLEGVRPPGEAYDPSEDDADAYGQGGPYYGAPPGPNDGYAPDGTYDYGDDDDPDEPAAGDYDDPDDQDPGDQPY